MSSLATDHPRPDSGLFFAERLPAPPGGESDRETEERVRLALEARAPLPLERLAYGWVRLRSGDLLAYAAPVERTPAHAPEAPPGTVLPAPSAILAPPGVTLADIAAATRTDYADLRPRAELAALRERARTALALARLRLPLRLAAGVGCALILGAVGLRLHAAATSRRLGADAARIASAETASDLLATLDNLDAASRSPFDLLAVVNACRPDGVTFSRMRADAAGRLVLEGRGPGMTEVNRMTDALRACGVFSSVALPKITAASGRTTFELRLAAGRWPRIADAATPAAPASK